jgi:hypothetical protein
METRSKSPTGQAARRLPDFRMRERRMVMRSTRRFSSRSVCGVLLTSLVAICVLLSVSATSARAGDVALSFSFGTPVVYGYGVPVYNGYANPGFIVTTHYRTGPYYPYNYGPVHYYGGHRADYRWFPSHPWKNHGRDEFRNYGHGGKHRDFDRHNGDPGQGNRDNAYGRPRR